MDNRRTRGEGPRESSDELDDDDGYEDDEDDEDDENDEGDEQLPMPRDEQLDTLPKGGTECDYAGDEWKDMIQSEQTI